MIDYPFLCHILFLFKFLEDISPFCGATDTPVLDFWWCLPWVSKPGWNRFLRAFSHVWSSDWPLVWHLLTVCHILYCPWIQQCKGCFVHNTQLLAEFTAYRKKNQSVRENDRVSVTTIKAIVIPWKVNKGMDIDSKTLDYVSKTIKWSNNNVMHMGISVMKHERNHLSRSWK